MSIPDAGPVSLTPLRLAKASPMFATQVPRGASPAERQITLHELRSP